MINIFFSTSIQTVYLKISFQVRDWIMSRSFTLWSEIVKNNLNFQIYNLNYRRYSIHDSLKWHNEDYGCAKNNPKKCQSHITYTRMTVWYFHVARGTCKLFSVLWHNKDRKLILSLTIVSKKINTSSLHRDKYCMWMWFWYSQGLYTFISKNNRMN